MNQSENPVFCVNPWIQQAITSSGKLSLCMIAKPFSEITSPSLLPDLHNSSDMCEARQGILSGKKLFNCQQCFAEEQSGLVSARQRANSNVPDLDSIAGLTSLSGAVRASPVEFIINLGNTCKLGCVMCREEESNTWVSQNSELAKVVSHRILQADFRTRPKAPAMEFSLVDSDAYIQALKVSLLPAKRIFFSGGEPFDSPRLMEILEFLIQKEVSSNISVEIQTAGYSIPHRFWEILSFFKKVELLFSVDATGEQNDYIRFPSNWGAISSNIIKASTLLETVNITPTVSILNVLEIPRLYKWIWDQKFKTVRVNFGFVTKPTFLDIRFFDQAVKKHINRQIWDFIGANQADFSSDYFNSLKGVDSYMWQHRDLNKVDILKDYLHALDVTRSTSAPEVFPHLMEIL